MTDASPKGSALDSAKERLLEMRNEVIAGVIREGPGRYQVAAIDTALAAIDEAPADAEPASRAVVSDDGKVIRLTLYVETGAVAAVELDPIRAITLAAELIDAALLRLNRE
jgi:hypothetical protein